MKRNILKLSFFLVISISIQIFTSELWVRFFDNEKPNVFESANGEHFNPSFSRLSSIPIFTAYCDSIYGNTQINASDSERYAGIVIQTLRDRFYHGYCYYRLGQNSMAFILAPLINKDLSAIVIPDDILKHPSAACSQQSIVGMEAFKGKGFKVRKVGFFAQGYGGHFCFEAFFNGKWHFFDPDLEPKLSIMSANHFPSISDLVKHDSLLQRLYYRQNRELVEKLFFTYSYGAVNKFPAPHARIFQYITKYLSYTIWLFFILLYFFMRQKVNYSKKKEVCVELPGTLAPEIRA